MTDPRRFLLLLLFPVGLMLSTAILAQDAASTNAASGTRVAVDTRPAAWTGAGRCSTYACHGDNGPDGDHRSAYTTWLARDPHSRAGAVLVNELSDRIEARLAAPSGREPLQAERDQRCLACHAAPSVAHDASLVRQVGVDCETCHGAAAGWVEPHTFPGWKKQSAEKKSSHGMTLTKDLASRAALCVRCHVGGPGREVDHDLIAAGHPRLNFELVSYLDALPRHWGLATEQQTPPDFEAQAWAVGQAVSARAALELLAARVAAAKSTGKEESERSQAVAWPEFAEYSCAACHHSLGGALDASEKKRPAESLGLPPWGTWYLSLPGRKAGGPDDPLAKLRRLMDGPAPAPAEVEELARDAMKSLDSELKPGTTPDAKRLRELLGRVAAAGQGPEPLCWDRAAQITLAASALGRSLERQGQPLTPAMKSAIEEMFREVRRPFSAEGPDDRKLGGFRKALEQLRQ